jgi:integrase
MSEEKKLRRVRGSGSLFRKGNNRVWTLQYYKDDPVTGQRVRVREATGLVSRVEAQKLLTTRLYQIDRGELFETRRAHAVRIEDLIADLKQHYLINRNPNAARRLDWLWGHLKSAFANVLAANLTTDAINAYIRQRQVEKAANATINRELATLRRALNLGKRSTPPKVRAVPAITMLKEDNARQGFVEHADFSRLVAETGEQLWLRTFLELAFTYGWRKGELLALRVRHVNLKEGTIRLDPGMAKNREGREVRMTAKVRELLQLAVDKKPAEKFVLTRADGKPVRDFRQAWANLCVRAGCGQFLCRKCGEPWTEKTCKCGCEERKYKGLIAHDLRRSAACAARRAGVPESVIMQMGGWKTAQIFRRYAIVSAADQRDAVERLEQARADAKHVSPRSAPFSTKPAPRASSEAELKVQ